MSVDETASALDVPAPRGLARLFREPMWVLGLVLLMDEIDKNIIRGLSTPCSATSTSGTSRSAC